MVRRKYCILVGVLASTGIARAQIPLDQSNTAIIQRDSKAAPEAPPPTRLKVETDSAEPTVALAPTDKGIFVGAIRVAGAKQIGVEAFSPAIEPYIGRTVSNAELARLSRAVADIARARGYKFASAYVAPQALSLGVLTITLDEGAIATVRIEGSKNRQLKEILVGIAGEARPYDLVERHLLLAADIAGIALKRIRFVREAGRGVLIVAVAENRFSGRIGFDTLGTKAVGPARAIASFSGASLVSAGDQLSVQAATTPLQPNELGFVALRYALPLDADGTVLTGSVAFARSEPGGILKQFASVGHSATYGLSLSHQLIRSRARNLYVALGFEQLSSRQSLFGLRARDTQSAALSLTIGANQQLFGGRLRGETTLMQGLSGFGATPRGDPLSSRADAGPGFTRFGFDADWTGPLAGPLSLRLGATAQLASAPLYAEQELGIGGPRFGRAYSYSERSGDEGALGLVEVRADFNKATRWLDWVQPYAFVDGGRVTNIGERFGGGSLYSGGGGVRARLGGFDLGVEAAFPLGSERFDSGDHSPRFNLQLSKPF